MSGQTSRPAIPPGQVQLFLVDVAERGSEGILADRQLLDDEERRRADRFVFARDRELFTVAHALLRRVLSQALGVVPQELRYQLGPYGRPELAGAAATLSPPLRFNLSHSQGVAVCGLASDCELGVDVEDSRRHAPLDVADHYFAPSEVAALRALPLSAQPARFFEYWTLKESYIKARGLGLSLPLHSFAFRLEKGEPIGIAFSAGCPDEPSRWQFASFLRRDHYRIAVAIGKKESPLAIVEPAVRY